MKQQGQFLLKVSLSLGLLGYLLVTADYVAMQEVFGQVRPGYYVLAYVVGILAVLLSVYKWKLLLESGQMYRPMSELTELYLVGIFFNNFLPTSVGGDAMRIYLLSRKQGQKMLVFASVLVERITGLLALIFLLLAGLFVSGSLLPVVVKFYIGAALILSTLLLIVLFVKGKKENAVKIFPTAVVEPLNRLRCFFIESLSSASVVFKIVWLSLLFQILSIVIYVVIFKALSMDIPLADSFLIIPLLTLLTMLPISINGFGLREYTLVCFFSHYGYGKSHAIPVSVLFYGIIFFLSFLGGIIFLLMKTEDKRPS